MRALKITFIGFFLINSLFFNSFVHAEILEDIYPTEQSIENESLALPDELPSVFPESQKISIRFPEKLSGYELTLRNSQGETIQKGMIDSSGQSILEIPLGQEYTSLIVNSTNITPVKLQEFEAFSSDTIIIIIGVTLFSFCLAFFLGRRSTLHILKELREYVYDEEYD